MTEQDKQFLLKDLCARLPYGVKVQDTYYSSLKPITPWLVDMIKHEVRLYADENWQSIENIKPYLRPMSSMTEGEIAKYCELLNPYEEGDETFAFYEAHDFLNSIHVDYRGLIGKGLALEAPEDMYKI